MIGLIALLTVKLINFPATGILLTIPANFQSKCVAGLSHDAIFENIHIPIKPFAYFAPYSCIVIPISFAPKRPVMRRTVFVGNSISACFPPSRKTFDHKHTTFHPRSKKIPIILSASSSLPPAIASVSANVSH